MGKYVNVGLVPLLFLIILFTGCSTTCSNETLLTATSFYTVLRSPNYPGNYSNNQECGWKIRTRNQGYIVRLYVFDVSLEESDNCDHDSLSIYDGGLPSSDSLLAKLCGTTGSRRYFYSSGQEAFLKFTSDSSNTSKGFRLMYKAFQPLTTLPTSIDITTTTTTITAPDYLTCGTVRNLTAMSYYSRTLRSTNYPDPYPNNQECGWRIRADNQWYGLVQLYVEDINIQHSRNCDNDSLSIYDGGQPSSYNLLAKLCGTQGFNKFFFSSGREMYLKFKSDSTLTFRGFKLSYRAAVSGFPVLPTTTTTTTTTTTLGSTYCRTVRHLTASPHQSRTLVSPDYPDNYPNNQECRWRIRTDSQRYNSVRLYVADIILEDSRVCRYDSLSVYDGGQPSGDNLLAELCGVKGLNRYFYSSGQEILVKFTSDSSRTYRGFRLLYRAVQRPTTVPTTTTPTTPAYVSCRTVRDLTASPYHTTTLLSTYYPNNYPNNQECGWRIRTDSLLHDHLSLYVADFRLQLSDNCVNDSLSIYDGGQPRTNNLLVKLCGAKVFNRYFYSSGQEMFVQFKSDSSITFRGFKLRFRAITRMKTTIRPWPTTTPSNDTSISTDRLKLIIWPVVGLLVIVVLVVAFISCTRRKGSRQASRSTTSSTTPPRVPGVGANSSSQHGVYILPANQPSRPAETGTSHTNAAYSPTSPDATIPMQMAEAGPPPSYSEVMREVTKPPSYEEAIGGR
ncbi:scavenger receptor cysteine-rich domain-containing protein DMBT1-like [Babylonia areolata]|uniref:scavenger receptor cysteine-rich domain-containing protein DMBT1-like n=1 Tax=Babylonia areolata TaxID=304850 RepID=UPI003FD42DDE